MKLLLSWVFEHINVPLSSVDINDLKKQLTQKTTEIESVITVKHDIEQFSLVQVKKIDSDTIVCVNHQGNIIKIAKGTSHNEGEVYLAYFQKNTKKWRLATSQDLGSTRNFLLPSLHVDENTINLTALSETETIFEIDNNAIAHRPDLWSHRGFAREIAAIYGFSLKPLESLIHQIKVITDPESVNATVDSPFSITIENQSICSRFSGLYIKSIQSKKTTLGMAARLSLVDCKSIDMIVDCSNYVLYDIGQPIHTYDADLLPEKRIVVRLSDKGTTVDLLDSEIITLSADDIIVADGLTPISLAGIMGGIHTKVSSKTTSLFIESAHFDAYRIRQSASKHAQRTDAAIRFSRNIDPNNNAFGIMRYIKLLDENKVSYISSSKIQSVGTFVEPLQITVAHTFIEKRLGITIASQRILQILNTIELQTEKQGDVYHIVVPTNRSKRDISIPEDIVEEIGRLAGYETIVPQLPSVTTTPKSSMRQIRKKRALKDLLSFGFCMRELHNYSLYSENFLHKIEYSPYNSIILKNPISSDRIRLVSTLLVHLLEVIHIHREQQEALRFFEVTRCWQLSNENTISEKEMVAAVLFDKTKAISFYEGKAYVERLFRMFNIIVSYKTKKDKNFSLFDAVKSAAIYSNNVIIGHCGMSSSVINDILFEGKSIFMFELDTNAIFEETNTHRYTEISKFPFVTRDISLFLSHHETADELITMIHNIDNRILSVQIIDFFEKKEWQGKRALTLRVTIQDKEKTLSSEEINTIITIITTNCETRGIQIR